MQSGKTHIYGKHAVTEALREAPACLETVFLAPDVDDPELLSLIGEKGIRTEPLKAESVTQKVGREAKHQGVIARMDPSKLISDIGSWKIEASSDTCLVLLDGLEDPQNVGAVIRSAAAFGAAAVLLPGKRQSPLTGAVARASSGMVFRIPLVSVPDTVGALETLKGQGFTAYGLAMDGAVALADEAFSGPSVIVVGNESRGLSDVARAACDTLLRIPIHPRCESLNAAVSAGIVLSAWSAKHTGALEK